MIVRIKVPKQMAWQYMGHMEDAPKWARACVIQMKFGPPVLERRSGRQTLLPFEWLVKDLDSVDPLWFTDVDFRREYEVAK